MARVTLPSQGNALLDQSGVLDVIWRRFFEGLWKRTGANQDITITASSDTVLTFSYKGSDGVIRSGSITLA